MKTMTKRVLSLLFALTMLVSLVAATGLSVFAAETTFSSEEEIDQEKVLFTITADKFRFPYAEMCSDGVYDDPDASTGKAAVISYTDRMATGDNGLIKALTPANTLAFYCYGQTSKQTLPIGEPTIAQLQTISQKAGYSVLLFQDVELFPAKGDFYAYIFDCWGLQIPFTSEHVDSCVGELVDVYLYMKITGSITDHVNNPPAYYVEKIVVCQATAGDQAHVCSFGDWTITEDKHSRSCSGCGQVEESAHSWNDGVTTKEPSATADGEMVYTCTTCETTKTVKLDRIDSTVEPTTPSTSTTQPQGGNTGLIIAIGMIVLAIAIVVVAVILLKPKKKEA